MSTTSGSWAGAPTQWARPSPSRCRSLARAGWASTRSSSSPRRAPRWALTSMARGLPPAPRKSVGAGSRGGCSTSSS
eukprot:7334962-Pyramimonas_sp.AAC.1